MISSIDKDSKKCVFLINTEYVLLISLLYTKYHLLDHVLPVFVLIKNSERRFSNIAISKLPGEVYVYDNELHKNIIFPNRDYLKICELNNVEYIHFQNPQDIINSSLVSYFKKHNPKLKVTLVSDSIAIDRKILTKFRDRFIHYARLYFRKYFNNIPEISTKVWGYNNIPFNPDELIAHKNIGYQNFINSKDLFSKIQEAISLLSSVFNISLSRFKKAEILFFTQPNLNYSTYSTDIKRGYIKGVEDLCKLAYKHKKHMIIKVHPAEDPMVYKKFENEYVYLDKNSNTPAEIIINGLEHKKIVSFWSSISMYDIFSRHKHYWLYKLIGYKLPSDNTYAEIEIINNQNELDFLIFNLDESN